MPIIQDTYSPPIWARNGHVASIYPCLFRKLTPPPFVRERLNTTDNDFVDIDQLRNGHDKLIIHLHGLEGGSSSQYILSASQLFTEASWDVVELNHRSCSGEINRMPQMYHNGFTQDLHQLCQKESSQYKKIVLLGYSLGGNMVATLALLVTVITLIQS